MPLPADTNSMMHFIDSLALVESLEELGPASKNSMKMDQSHLLVIKHGDVSALIDRVKRLAKATGHVLQLVEQHVASDGTTAPPSAPPLHQLLPPGAASAVASLLCLCVLEVDYGVTQAGRADVLTRVFFAAGLPLRLAGACSALSQAISSSQAAGAATSSQIRCLESSGLPTLVQQMLIVFAAGVNAEDKRRNDSQGSGAGCSASSSSGSSGGSSALSQPSLVAAAPAAAELALAVLRSQQLLCCSGTRVTAVILDMLQLPAVARCPCLSMCALRVIEVMQEVALREGRAAAAEAAVAMGCLVATEALAQYTHFASVQQAMVQLGLAARCIHERLQGRSPVSAGAASAAAASGASSSSSSRQARHQQQRQQHQQQHQQQLLVPPFHQQLLEALGVAPGLLSGHSSGSSQFERLVLSQQSGSEPPRQPGSTYMSAVYISFSAIGISLAHIADQALQLPASRSGGGSTCTSTVSAAMPGATAAIQEPAVLVPLVLPTVRVMLECALLLGREATPVSGTLQICMMLLQHLQDRGITGLPELQQELRELLSLVLTLLLPAVRHAQERGSDADMHSRWQLVKVADITAATATMLGALYGANTSDEHHVNLDFQEHLVLDHTRDYCMLLESSVQRFSHDESRWLLTTVRILEVCAGAAARSNGRMAADDAAAQQLFALLLTCLKKAHQLAQFDSLDLAAARTVNSLKIALLCGRASRQNSSSSSRLWLVLAGRSLVALGHAVKRAVQEPATGETSRVDVRLMLICSRIRNKTTLVAQEELHQAVSQYLQQLVQAVLHDDAAWAAVSGPAAAADPAARLQLLADAKQLPGQLDAAANAWMRAAAVATSWQPLTWQCFAAAVGVPLAQQLEAFGVALCMQLPGCFCCNFHGCTSMATEQSELQLVSGPGTVCRGCKTARYCTAACQKAHWKDWHKPVCNGIKELQQQPAAASQQGK